MKTCESSLYPVQRVKMPERCVAARCSNNVSNPKKGISRHKIPFFGSTNPTAQRRRKRWLDFVLSKRKDWTPGETSSLCSLHFREDDFNFRLDSDLKHSLRSDDIETCVLRTIHAKEESEEAPSKREKRMVSNRRKCVKIFTYYHVLLVVLQMARIHTPFRHMHRVSCFCLL